MGGTLWYAIGIYMIGVATVLYFRPKVMFRDDGMWKEFGLATADEQTIFPFWMFALIWAILSYALANLMCIFFASVALNSTDEKSTVTAMNSSFIQPITQQPAFPTFPPPIPAAAAAAPAAAAPAPMMGTRAPGYYILDPYANPATPRYIYYGPEPPGFTPAAN